jgi:hypothetical protein
VLLEAQAVSLADAERALRRVAGMEAVLPASDR